MSYIDGEARGPTAHMARRSDIHVARCSDNIDLYSMEKQQQNRSKLAFKQWIIACGQPRREKSETRKNWRIILQK